AGVQVESLVEYVRLFEAGESAETRKQILESERTRIGKKIADLQAAYDLLDMKIERYDIHIIPAEKVLVGKIDEKRGSVLAPETQ
ncbi:MAG: MerR family transcriptional regulator, partial [Coriobacteriia bacterium]|nr:MerR family transcriptional regulator [Coriobacteriia bacterium]